MSSHTDAKTVSSRACRSAKQAMSQNVAERPTPAAAAEAKCPALGLSARKQAAIEMILLGQTDIAGAKALTVNRKTIYRWRVEDERFRDVLVQRRREVFENATDRLRAPLESALNVLGRQVADAYHPTSHRAARTLLTLAQVGQAVAAAKRRTLREFAPPMLSFRHARRPYVLRIGLTVPRKPHKNHDSSRGRSLKPSNIYAHE